MRSHQPRMMDILNHKMILLETTFPTATRKVIYSLLKQLKIKSKLTYIRTLFHLLFWVVLNLLPLLVMRRIISYQFYTYYLLYQMILKLVRFVLHSNYLAWCQKWIPTHTSQEQLSAPGSECHLPLACQSSPVQQEQHLPATCLDCSVQIP